MGGFECQLDHSRFDSEERDLSYSCSEFEVGHGRETDGGELVVWQVWSC